MHWFSRPTDAVTRTWGSLRRQRSHKRPTVLPSTRTTTTTLSDKVDVTFYEGDEYPASDVSDATEVKPEKWFVGSIDQGTTSTRFIIFNDEGTPVVTHQMGFENKHRHSGWHEQDPMELLSSVETCIEKAVEKFIQQGHDPKRIRSVGLTNQRETVVLWNKTTGKPVCDAMAWPDTRTAPLVRELKSREGADKIHGLCGMPLSTYPSSVKLMWLLENDEAVRAVYDEGNLAFGTVDSWLIYKLNGGVDRAVSDGEPIHVTDSTNASRTMFVNLRSLEYDDQLLDFFGIDRSKVALPRIVPSSDAEAFGALTRGPLQGVPITGCLGDQSSALVGQCGFEPGQAKNTYGTGCFLLYNVGDEPVISNSGLLSTVAYDFGPGHSPVYALEGSVAVGGSGLTFLQNNLGILDNPKEIDALAKTVPDNGGVYFVTAFSGLFAPYWIDDAQGTMFGLTAHTQKGHIARATLEATCHQTAAILEAMAADSGKALADLAVDGGLSNSDLCMQTQADLSGIPVDRPVMRETTALGAAIASGVASGVWKSMHDLRDSNSANRTVFTPSIDAKKRKMSRDRWERAVQMSRGWLSTEDEDDK
ncbi:glycerol kinase [Geosmithia morbida]|uniref:glycerol kinase n=1 Tax=Geosmithia morbida TaxID=1094350 RepID=A0A9P5D8H8_9HYPO|nr:glycerol kinase [Geosmithia morbida]KAF4125539.1 glycerol kinase [Geosmithia morbida]